jgi:hypothetical protein
MALAALGCDEDELAPPLAPSDFAQMAPCSIAEAPPPLPPMSLAAFTPQNPPRTIVIPLDGLELYADTPEGAWLRGLQPSVPHTDWFDRGRGYRWRHDSFSAPRYRRGRRFRR